MEIFNTLEDEARKACLAVGIEYKTVIADGLFHQTNITDDPRGRGDGRIKLFPDGQGGLCWNHKSGERQTFFINRKSSSTLSSQEKEEIKKAQQRRKKELTAKQDKSAQKALSLWVSAKGASHDHPYLIAKRIGPYFLRQAHWTKSVLIDGKWEKITIENVLLVPLYNEAGTLRNLQAIFSTKHPELARNKDFLTGAELSGLFSWVGDKTETVCLAEGFATAASIHQETGLRVYVCFSAGNLKAVGLIIRKHLPTSKLIFAADHDKSGVGLEKATVAAEAAGGFICFPPVEGMDFNDYSIYLQEAS